MNDNIPKKETTMKKKSKMNTTYISAATQKKMAKVFSELYEQPKKFNKDEWGVTVKDLKKLSDLMAFYEYIATAPALRNVHDAKPPCGTIACLTGQTLITIGKLKPKLKLGKKDFYIFNEESTVPKARKLLGLSRDQATSLFYPNLWPYKFSDAIRNQTPGTKKYLNVAKRRWEYMIKTGE
jgi:hypothetical protein